VSEENRKFNSNWEKSYSFLNNNGKPQCLVRLQLESFPNEFLFISSGITAPNTKKHTGNTTKF